MKGSSPVVDSRAELRYGQVGHRQPCQFDFLRYLNSKLNTVHCCLIHISLNCPLPPPYFYGQALALVDSDKDGERNKESSGAWLVVKDGRQGAKPNDEDKIGLR